MSAWVRTAVLVVAAASTAAAWQVRPEKAGIASSIAVDSAGDVFAAIGIPIPRRFGTAAAIVKLSHENGAQLWRRRLRAGGTERSDFIYDMRVASNGDVIAAGSLDHNEHPVFFVSRLEGRSGRARWRRLVQGRQQPDYEERADSVAIDGSGDVIAAGTIESLMSAQYHMTNDFAVVKFAGETGEERWRFQLNGTADHFDWAFGVAVEGNGDVVAMGRVTDLAPSDPFAPLGETKSTVMKLARDDGRLLWRHDLDPVGGRSVAVDSAGDVLVVGDTQAGLAFAVTKLAGATGEPLWTAEVGGGGGINFWQPSFKVGVLPSGDVAAVGVSADANGVPAFTAVRLDGATGTERWRQDLRGSDDYGLGRALAIGEDGRLVVGGQLRNRRSCYDATVVRLDPEAGGVVRQRRFDGTATATECDAPSCGESRGRWQAYAYPQLCGRPGAGIDQDDLFAISIDAQGGITVAGRLSDGPRGSRRGFVARLPW